MRAIDRELAEAAKTFKPRQRLWTADDVKTLLMFYGKVPVRLLAEKLGRPVGAIRDHYQRNKDSK